MTKNILIIIAIVAFVGCNNEEKKLEQTKLLYEQVQDHFDPTSAQYVLNELLLLQPENTDYKDSLARLYIQTGNYKGGTLLAQQLHDIGKADIKLSELLGAAYQQLKEASSATAIFTQLFNKTKDYKYIYQNVAVEYDTKNYAAFDSLSRNLIELAEQDSIVAATTIDFPGVSSNVPQLIPIKAATYFLIGKNAFDNEQDLQKAVDYYQKSVIEYQSFELPQYYLSEIAKQYGGRR
jgi:tetratricopeptide (TPR) repeat protein